MLKLFTFTTVLIQTFMSDSGFAEKAKDQTTILLQTTTSKQTPAAPTSRWKESTAPSTRSRTLTRHVDKTKPYLTQEICDSLRCTTRRGSFSTHTTQSRKNSVLEKARLITLTGEFHVQINSLVNEACLQGREGGPASSRPPASMELFSTNPARLL